MAKGLVSPCCFLRLAISLCLDGTAGLALFVIAVVCSSWSVVNSGTSQRDLLTPYGQSNLNGVRAGNQMVARQGGWFLLAPCFIWKTLCHEPNKSSTYMVLLGGSKFFRFLFDSGQGGVNAGPFELYGYELATWKPSSVVYYPAPVAPMGHPDNSPSRRQRSLAERTWQSMLVHGTEL